MAVVFSFLVISGYLLGIGLAIFCIFLCLFIRPGVVAPVRYQKERLARASARPGRLEPDIAWALYPFRQARADLRRLSIEITRRYRRLWTWPVDAFFRGWYGNRYLWWFFFPVPLSILFILAMAGAVALATYALFAAVTAICVAASLLVLGVVAGVLRAAENSRRRRMRTDVSCPKCYHVTPWAAYQCSGCDNVHRDIRPGRLGLIWRRCECGTRIPTMPLRAAWRLDALCQRCRAELPVGSGAVRDIRIPILGDPSAGKTRFLYAALHSLDRAADRAEIAHGYPDTHSKNEAEKALVLIRSGGDTPKTSALLPPPFSIQIDSGRQQTFVHMFDAAGEILRNPELHDELGFLSLAQGLVYVLDPFSIGFVRNRLAGHNAEEARLAGLSAGDPENAFDETVSRLRDSGVEAREQRLAVVISKVDLLQNAGLEKMPEVSEDIERWLAKAGVHNLVLAARRDFAAVRYFSVTSQALPDACAAHDPGFPLLWLLRSHGVRLPADLMRSRVSGPTHGQSTSRWSDREDDGHSESPEAT